MAILYGDTLNGKVRHKVEDEQSRTAVCGQVLDALIVATHPASNLKPWCARCVPMGTCADCGHAEHPPKDCPVTRNPRWSQLQEMCACPNGWTD